MPPKIWLFATKRQAAAPTPGATCIPSGPVTITDFTASRTVSDSYQAAPDIAVYPSQSDEAVAGADVSTSAYQSDEVTVG